MLIYIVSCTRGCRIDPAIYSLLTASTPLKVTEGKRGFKWQRLTLYTVEPVASHPGHGTAGGAFLGSGIIPVTAAYRGKSHFPILIGGMDVQDKCPDHYIDRMSHSCRVPHFQVLENMHAEDVRVAIFSWHFRVTHFVTPQGFRADSGSYKQHSAMVCSIARLGLLYYNHGESGSPIRQEVSRFFVIMCTFWLLWYCIMVFLQFLTTRSTRITFSTFSVRLRYLVSNILTHAGSVNGWSYNSVRNPYYDWRWVEARYYHSQFDLIATKIPALESAFSRRSCRRRPIP